MPDASAISGQSNSETGRIVLETSPSETEVQVEIADERFDFAWIDVS